LRENESAPPTLEEECKNARKQERKREQEGEKLRKGEESPDFDTALIAFPCY
jgi:hypothetical protein